jgi:hypothetical protein
LAIICWSASSAILAKEELMEKVAAAHTNLAVISEHVIYLMGLSFMLGSFFTILLLLLLDFMRRHHNPEK